MDQTASSPTVRFPHRMLQEIYEQPDAISAAIRHHVSSGVIFRDGLGSIEAALQKCNRIIIAASGSSRHAGLAAEIMIEDLAGIAVDVEYSSEYCYRSTHATSEPVVMVITQSGETADTIAALRVARDRKAHTLALSNVAGSTASREAEINLLTHAGPELSVPATKSFTTQLAALFLLALFLAQKRNRISTERFNRYLHELESIPNLLRDQLPAWDTQALAWARQHKDAQDFLYLGRAVHYPIAREGALKLKESSYIHGEGYPTGELKHGPNALVDADSPVVILATSDRSDSDSVLRYEKTLGVIEDVTKQGGKVLAIVSEADNEAQHFTNNTISIPRASELVSPILEVVPLQLFAYHVAVLNGCDVDHPRNLVKAVTRE